MLLHVCSTSRLLATVALCAATTVAVAQAPAATPKVTTATTAPATATNANNKNAGKVWGNMDSKIYHCEGDHYWGNTKNGDYMTLADAKAKGMTAAKNSKNCKQE